MDELIRALGNLSLEVIFFHRSTVGGYDEYLRRMQFAANNCFYSIFFFIQSIFFSKRLKKKTDILK